MRFNLFERALEALESPREDTADLRGRRQFSDAVLSVTGGAPIHEEGTLFRRHYVVDPGRDFIGWVAVEVPYIRVDEYIFVPKIGQSGLLAISTGYIPTTVYLQIRHVGGLGPIRFRHEHYHEVKNLREIGQQLTGNHRKCSAEAEIVYWHFRGRLFPIRHWHFLLIALLSICIRVIASFMFRF